MSSRLSSFWQDLRSGTRRLGRTPGFSTAAVLTLAIGIGASTAMSSVVYGVLLKPLPFDEADRLVSVWTRAPKIGSDRMVLAPAQYFTYREENHVFDDLAIWVSRPAPLNLGGGAVEVRTLTVTDGFLSILRLRPALGRWFASGDSVPGAPARVLISHRCWQQRFGSDPQVVGRQVQVDGQPAEVIGVLPRSFTFLETDAELIRPLALDRAATRIEDFSYVGLARLKRGVTLDQATRDVGRMLPLVPQRFAPDSSLKPNWYADAGMAPEVRRLSQDASGDLGDLLWPLMGTIGCVLLIACANVANLFLIRAEGRRQEFAVRAALGAGRFRLAWALVSESLLLALGGGVLGLGLAAAAVRLVRAIAPAALRRVGEIGLDPAVVGFAVIVSILAGLFLGCLPASQLRFRASALNDGGRGSSDGRSRHRLRGALVVAEIALALLLLVSSALMVRTFWALRSVDPGVSRADEVLTFGIWVPPSLATPGDPLMRKHQEVMDRMSAVPGVQAVGLASWISFDGTGGNNPLLIEDRPEAAGQAPVSYPTKRITPGYIESIGTRLVAGRALTWQEMWQCVPVAFVNERLARQLWRTPGATIGRRVRSGSTGPWREVIGVLADERADGLASPAPPIVFYPALVDKLFGGQKSTPRFMVYAVRSPQAGSAAFLSTIQKAVWSVSPDLPLVRIRRLDDLIDRSMAQTSFAMVMLAIAAGVSLLLGLVGVYAVISYITTQRTWEVGIRMALGAQARDVTRLFLRHGIGLAVSGVAVGLVLAAGLSHTLAAMLFGVSPTDTATYAGAAVALTAVSLAAAYVPARRAARRDAAVALRRG